MTYTPPKLLTFLAFIAEYGDNPSYELIDGELRDMEPTGSDEEVSGNIAGRIYAEILRTNFNWLIPTTCLIKPPAAEATALRPDVIVLDKVNLSQESLWQKKPIICNANTIKLVAEVVSTNWQDDYARKVEEYAFLEIPEYWIVDFRSLGGLQFIGNPKQPTFTVCQLVNGVYQQQQYRLGDAVDFRSLGGLQFIRNPKQPTFTVYQLVNGVYQQQQYRLGDAISSYLLPNLELKLDDIMP